MLGPSTILRDALIQEVSKPRAQALRLTDKGSSLAFEPRMTPEHTSTLRHFSWKYVIVDLANTDQPLCLHIFAGYDLCERRTGERRRIRQRTELPGLR